MPAPEDRKITVHFNAIPPRATAQQKGAFVNPRTKRIVFYKKKRQADEEAATIFRLKAKKPVGFKPMEGPLLFELTMVWPYRKSEKKSVVKSWLEIPMPVRPDCSNLVKMIEDAVTQAGYWHDDSQCSTVIIKKRWGPKAYWRIHIEPDWPTPLPFAPTGEET